MANKDSLLNYGVFLAEIKGRVEAAQTRAILAVNSQLIQLYWEIGQLLHNRMKTKGWGRGIIPKLARDLHNELPEVKGFSERNMGRMVAFYREYPNLQLSLPPLVAKIEKASILPPLVAKLNKTGLKTKKTFDSIEDYPIDLICAVPWAHHILLMEKIKNNSTRKWYMEKILAHGWSKNILVIQIEVQAHRRQGAAVTNFREQLPPFQSDLVQQTLKDPYIFDFITLQKPFHERELETALVLHIEKFLVELGQGFSFVGRQYHLNVGENDYYIDLLFYHLKLRSFVVIELKKGEFKPEYAGKLNFYCNVVDDVLRHASDQKTIGLMLCKTKDDVLAEYALRGIDKPIGIASYELTRSLPEDLKSVLPSIEDIEAELNSGSTSTESRAKP